MKSFRSAAEVRDNRVPGRTDHPDVEFETTTRTVTVEIPVLQCPDCGMKFHPTGADPDRAVEQYERHIAFDEPCALRPSPSD